MSDPPASPERDPSASPEGEADGGQATKERRALSMSRDGGQERYPHSMLDVERSMFDAHLFHAKQIPSGYSKRLVLWARILYSITRLARLFFAQAASLWSESTGFSSP